VIQPPMPLNVGRFSSAQHGRNIAEAFSMAFKGRPFRNRVAQIATATRAPGVNTPSEAWTLSAPKSAPLSRPNQVRDRLHRPHVHRMARPSLPPAWTAAAL
jgi:hypothetical protein